MPARSASLLATRRGKLLLLNASQHPLARSTRRPRVTPEGLIAAYEDLKGAAAGAIKARLAASQPLAEVL